MSYCIVMDAAHNIEILNTVKAACDRAIAALESGDSTKCSQECMSARELLAEVENDQASLRRFAPKSDIIRQVVQEQEWEVVGAPLFADEVSGTVKK